MQAKFFAQAGESVLLIEEGPDGIFLYEFRPDGFIGDTWHENIEYAKEQAGFQFGVKESDWRTVPSGVADPVAFARKKFKLRHYPRTVPF